MNQDNETKRRKKPGNWVLMASGLFAVVFIANVIVGKISISQGATQVAGLGDLGEFFVLMIAVILFVIACLARERNAKASD